MIAYAVVIVMLVGLVILLSADKTKTSYFIGQVLFFCGTYFTCQLISTVTKRLLAIALLATALTLSACATPGSAAFWGCEFGKGPQIVQTAVSAISAALVGATWEQELTDIGKDLAPGQLDCIVAAVVASTQGKHMLSPSGVTLVDHGRAWLAKHPAKQSCVQRYGM